ncbi:MAG TPA: hypothetical protein VNT81_15525 [Vicinamibacterales bacterium]|nr:hypothetical protein [Vicinamibacterales bacterium]
MLRRIGALVAVVSAIACAGTPTEPSPTPLTLALQTSAWETISDPQPYSLSNQGAALTFDFPSSGSMHYLFTASPLASVHGTLVASFTITTSGPVLFRSLDPLSSQCTLPISVRPFLWANNNGEGPYDRWWSNPRAYTLAAGSGTVTVPLKAENWSSVNGRFGNVDIDTKYQFDRALLNVTRLGLTFGGGCSFGHGINIQGGMASFALTDYRIQ